MQASKTEDILFWIGRILDWRDYRWFWRDFMHTRRDYRCIRRDSIFSEFFLTYKKGSQMASL